MLEFVIDGTLVAGVDFFNPDLMPDGGSDTLNGGAAMTSLRTTTSRTPLWTTETALTSLSVIEPTALLENAHG